MGTKKRNQPQAGGVEAPLHEIIVLLVRWEKALADIVCNNENTKMFFFGIPQMSVRKGVELESKKVSFHFLSQT